MKLTTKRTCEITITLDEKESAILRGILQNPSNSMDPANEPAEMRRVRTELYNELHEALGGYNPAG